MKTLSGDLPVDDDDKKSSRKNGAKGKGKQSLLFAGDDSDDNAFVTKKSKPTGPLLQTKFHRVVLDEVSVTLAITLRNSTPADYDATLAGAYYQE